MANKTTLLLWSRRHQSVAVENFNYEKYSKFQSWGQLTLYKKDEKTVTKVKQFGSNSIFTNFKILVKCVFLLIHCQNRHKSFINQTVQINIIATL